MQVKLCQTCVKLEKWRMSINVIMLNVQKETCQRVHGLVRDLPGFQSIIDFISPGAYLNDEGLLVQVRQQSNEMISDKIVRAAELREKRASLRTV